jgi:hypothetical protein
MQFEYAKAALVGLWMLAVLIAGVSLDATNPVHWIAVATLAIVPPVIVRKLWRVPAPTLSERINEARR